MYRSLLTSKIHRAAATQADPHRVGSIKIDQELTAAAGLIEGEQVRVVDIDIDNGGHLAAHAIPDVVDSGIVGVGSGVLGVNGAVS
ncbi:aspartate 1-decarboxylase [Pseudofrankia sp. BMG5.37]|uniref:aspartate 1-decarboxylase n=1 Tax=Pseudofrankia sp. BMG5.37 TaxID=3050035 RepID=UPI0008D9FA1B|nr:MULTISPECIES: aspartate 1-decarboxylase [unclassified Pseudofrankia]MDT3439074.1 aspartate 1-decarboxylase [Pseudofrankia sp. BMG5.37]OHV45785.1 hypothetical protein BCD48_21725 [Pseudofrankia sp. BMG5.36]